MMLPLLLALSMTSSTPAMASPSIQALEDGIHLTHNASVFKASLLEGLELSTSVMLSHAPPLRISDDLRLGLTGLPSLDEGGGVSSGTRPLLALVLGLLLGFGTGHLVAQDRNGFVLFLIIDLAIIVISNVFEFLVVHGGLFFGLGGLALLVSHIIQGIDAYGESSGQRILQLTRESEVRIANAGSGLAPPVSTTRTYALAF